MIPKQGTRFDPQAMLNMGVTLYVNDQAKQRYFNPSRYLIMTTRFADAQRNLDMDTSTWNQFQASPVGQIAGVIQQPTAPPVAKALTIDDLNNWAKSTFKPEALL